MGQSTTGSTRSCDPGKAQPTVLGVGEFPRARVTGARTSGIMRMLGPEILVLAPAALCERWAQGVEARTGTPRRATNPKTGCAVSEVVASPYHVLTPSPFPSLVARLFGFLALGIPLPSEVTNHTFIAEGEALGQFSADARWLTFGLSITLEFRTPEFSLALVADVAVCLCLRTFVMPRGRNSLSS